jgi:Skp family chaperone for outer membrane proteins
MKKIIFTTSIIFVIIMTSTMAEKIDCTQFDKVSAKYIECSAKNLKEISSELKLKATVGAEELKEKITTNAKSGKKKLDKLNLKEKLIRFKNSKSLNEFKEK